MQNPLQENVVPLAMPNRRLAPVMLPTPLPSGPGPSLVPFPRWLKACDRVSAALLAGETRLVVSGPPGTGKTLLLDQVSRVLRAAGWTVVLRLADAAPPPVQHGSMALLIDEADRLSRESLQQLLLSAPGPIVLAGLDALQSRVAGATQIVLSPLGREEARDYIAQWLELTGRAPGNLEAAAMRRTVEISAGVPRLASTLLSAAAWLADSTDDPVITIQHVEEAAALRSCFVPSETDIDPGAEDAPERTNTPLLVAVAASMLLLGAGAYVATRYYPAETDRTIAAIRGQALQLQATISERLGGPAPIKLAAVAPAKSPDAAAIPPVRAVPPVNDSSRPVPDAVAPAAPLAAAAPNPPPPDSEPVAKTEPSPPRATEPAATTAVAEPSPPPPPPAPPPQPEAVASAPQPAGTLEPRRLVLPPPLPVVATATPVPAAATATPAPATATPSPELATLPVPATAPPSPVLASATAYEPYRKLPAETVSLLVRRGSDMMAIGDVSAARLLFGRAAEAGDAQAMLEMGRTFDPAVLAQASPMLSADPAEAARWYRRAADAGNKAAEEVLRRTDLPRGR